MTVVQCWDDGVTSDLRVMEILRRHKAKATFNLNAGKHTLDRSGSWIHKGNEIARLGWNEMAAAYDGFMIANHSLTHPRLETLPTDDLRHEIVEGRARLQDFFNQPVLGFAYPYGSYNEQVMAAVREADHVYARTVKNVEQVWPPDDPMEFHPNCHFLHPEFWTKYEAAKTTGVFYFWGHSYEMISEPMWIDFEENMKRISADPEACWADVVDLFTVSENN